MAFSEDQMLFGAEWDPTGLIKGADAAVKALTGVATAQESVNKTLIEGEGVAQQAAATITKSYSEAEKSVKKFSDTANKPIVPTLDNSKMIESITAIRENFNKTLGGLDFSGFEELETKLQGAKDEFEALNVVIEESKKKLATLKPGTKDFEDLNKIIAAGTQLLSNYNKETGKTETSTKSLRARLKELRDEMTKLEDAGQDQTERYKQLQLQAAKLTDQYSDMQQTIKVLASDTKAFDFGLAAANSALAGFQLYTGALSLFGVKSEDAAQVQAKLLAVMNLVQGAQQLQNLLLKENTLRVLGADIVNKAYAATQRIVALALGTTTVATKTLSAALLATGIGALVIGIGFLISKLIEWSDTTDDAKEAQDRLTQSIKDQSDALDDDLKSLDFNNKIKLEKLKQAGLSEAAFYEQNKENRKAQILRIEDEIQNLQIQAQYRTGQALLDTQEQIRKLSDKIIDLSLEDTEAKEKERTRILEESRKKQKEISDKHIADEKAAQTLLDQIRFELSLHGKNEEQQELLKLQKEFEAQKAVLIKGGKSIADAQKLYEEKRLDITLKYGNMRTEEERKIMNDLLQVDIDEHQKRIDNIRNELEREGQSIELEFKKQKEELQSKQTSLLNAFLTDRNNGIISPEEYNALVAQTNATFDRLFFDLEQSINQKKEDLAAKLFQKNLQGVQDLAGTQQDSVANDASRQREQQAQLFTAGKINFETYQKAITAITQDETLKRLQIEKLELETQYALIAVRLNLMHVSQTEHDALVKQEEALKTEIQKTNEAIAAAGVQAKQQTKDNSFVDQFNAIAGAYNNLASSIANFFAKINQAQQQSLTREIAFQQTRVDNARLIAERGNAEYLELEQKRLDDLEQKREKAAQRQIAINNALVLSEATVAAISAIAKATEEGNALYAVAALAAVIGAIAAAYQFVNSLEGQSTEFFEGTPFVQRGRNKPGRDTIPARVNEGEAIIPTDTNAEYHKAVETIYYKKIPAEVLHKFIDSYSGGAIIPTVDYSRLGVATQSLLPVNMEETNNKLENIEEALQNVVKNLHNMGNVKLTLDERGFALSILRAARYQYIISKS